MAEARTAAAVAGRAGPGGPVGPRGPVGYGRVREGLRVYGLIAAMWVRSTTAYPLSFVMSLVSGLLLTGLDFVAILLMFSRVDALGGYALPEVALLYGLAATAFGVADLVLGSAGRLGARVRDGSLDTLLLRPAPVLAQAAADRFALRRLSRITQGLLVLGWALVAVDVEWTAAKALLVPVTVVSGSVIFGALLVAGAAFQFVTQDAAEVQSAFTYGGQTMLQYPPTVFGRELVRGVTFVLPLAFVNWVPAAYVLGRPYPLGLPEWTSFAPPLVAALCCVPAGLAWRAGLRSYRSTGS
ncbi:MULTISPECIES: ABC transporter permease [unclassified Streptomyces]|uniref:ABC transporter permease n=1 Tax=unclassified Streptomyces TaxID=2593676 RepID=UPI003811F775